MQRSGCSAFPRATTAERLDESKLRISLPDRLIKAEQAEQWFRNRFSPHVPTDPSGTELPDPYPGSTDLIRLSRVFHNADRAVVYVSDTCGSLCRIFGWQIVQKSQGGSWRLLPNRVRELRLNLVNGLFDNQHLNEAVDQRWISRKLLRQRICDGIGECLEAQ